MALAEAAATSTNSAATVFAILASAVIVLGGLAALVRAIWKTATTLRDNTRATQNLTEKLDEYVKASDGRFEGLNDRVISLEHHIALLREQIQHGGKP